MSYNIRKKRGAVKSDEDLEKKIEQIYNKISSLENDIKIIKEQLYDYQLEIACINWSLHKWDKMEYRIYVLKKLINKYFYSYTKKGIKGIFFVLTKVVLLLFFGFISGIILKALGLSTLFNNIVMLVGSN